MPNTDNKPRTLSKLLGAGPAKRSNVVAIDLGQRTTKAIYLERSGEKIQLVQYALQDAPVFDKAPSAELLGDHLKSIVESIKYRGRRVAVLLGVSDALLRHAELPGVPVNDMRLMLKYN